MNFRTYISKRALVFQVLSFYLFVDRDYGRIHPLISSRRCWNSLVKTPPIWNEQFLSTPPLRLSGPQVLFGFKWLVCCCHWTRWCICSTGGGFLALPIIVFTTCHIAFSNANICFTLILLSILSSLAFLLNPISSSFNLDQADFHVISNQLYCLLYRIVWLIIWFGESDLVFIE